MRTSTSTPNFYPTKYPHNTGFDVLSLRFKVHLNELVLKMWPSLIGLNGGHILARLKIRGRSQYLVVISFSTKEKYEESHKIYSL